MKTSDIWRIQKSKKNYRVASPTQTGFSSPATHYNEPRIDLNDVLVKNASSTFFIRVADDSFEEFNILKRDVLIVDKSLSAKENNLAVVIKEGNFEVFKIEKNLTEEITVWGIITHIIKSAI